MELKSHLAFNSLRYGVYETMLQVYGHHKLKLVHVGGDELRSIYVATLKLKEIGLDVHFCIIAIAIKGIGSKR